MRRFELIGFVGGLIIFVLALLVSRFLKIPPLGRWEVVVVGLGWVLLLIAAAQTTRGWVAPALIVAGEGLNRLGDRLVQRLISSESGGSAYLVLALTLAFSAVSLVLWVSALILMIRGVMRRLREREQG